MTWIARVSHEYRNCSCVPSQEDLTVPCMGWPENHGTLSGKHVAHTIPVTCPRNCIATQYPYTAVHRSPGPDNRVLMRNATTITSAQ